MTYRQEAETVLTSWREVERALQRATPGSPEADELQAEVLRLRDRYQALVDRAGEAHAGMEPPSTLLNDLSGSA
jgi:hypothetical protein